MKNALSFVFILSIIFAQGQEKTRLSLEHYKNYEWTSNPTLSPDGEQILYSRTWINLVDDKRETDLWIMNKDGSTNRFFLKGSSGKWSPDGSKIAFTNKKAQAQLSKKGPEWKALYGHVLNTIQSENEIQLDLSKLTFVSNLFLLPRGSKQKHKFLFVFSRDEFFHPIFLLLFDPKKQHQIK